MAVAESVTVPASVAPAAGAVTDTVGATVSRPVLLLVLLIVTVTGDEVVALPAASRATARNVCAPFAADVVVHATWKGAAVASVPIDDPSKVNQTPATPTLSEADADIVTVPDSTEPDDGDETETVGAFVSVLLFLTLTTTGVADTVFPALSRPMTVTVLGPSDSERVSQPVLHDPDVICGPTLLPETWNCTDESPAELAWAESVTMPLTVALADTPPN